MNSKGKKIEGVEQKKNQQLAKENSCLVESLKAFEHELDEERQERIALEQYGRREMLEVSEIKAFEGENCKQLIVQVCQLAMISIIMDNIEIAHKIKNGSIIVKFSGITYMDQDKGTWVHLK